MKVALAQINTIVGDLEGNSRRILETARRAAEQGAELVLYPELALPGYPPRDLLELASFLQANLEHLGRLHRKVPVPCLVGLAQPVAEGAGPRAHNTAALIGTGAGEPYLVHKTLLPTYDVFDECRYFRAAGAHQGAVVELGGHRIGITICEDIWNHADFWPHRRYVADPVAAAVQEGASVILNLSASPYTIGRPDLRVRIAAAHARLHGVPVALCNLVGGNDDLIFDGASFVVDSSGELRARAAFAAEDLLLVDLAALKEAPQRTSPSDETDEIRQALVLGLRDYVHKCGFEQVVLGVSGGIDSAVVALLACQALGPERVTGIAMPSRYSSPGSVADARQLAANLGLRLRVLEIEPIYRAYLETLAPILGDAPMDVTEENIQARIRGALLMAHSNRTGSLVLATGNKSELAVGYCTLYGDMCGGLAVISDLFKQQVYALAQHANAEREVIPRSILEKPPSAELAPDQTDQDSLPPYEQLDRILRRYVEEHQDARRIISETGLPADLVLRMLTLVDRSEYKRSQMPPGLRISSKAFGGGRRFPIAKGYRHQV